MTPMIPKTYTFFRYKDGYTEEDFDIVEDPFTRNMIKRVFSMENASQKERYNVRKSAAIKKYQLHPLDFSSPGVQVAMLSEKIYNMVINFNQERKKNIKTFRKVQDTLFKRAKLLEYLRWNDYNRYYEIVEDYKINVDH